MEPFATGADLHVTGRGSRVREGGADEGQAR